MTPRIQGNNWDLLQQKEAFQNCLSCAAFHPARWFSSRVSRVKLSLISLLSNWQCFMKPLVQIPSMGYSWHWFSSSLLYKLVFLLLDSCFSPSIADTVLQPHGLIFPVWLSSLVLFDLCQMNGNLWTWTQQNSQTCRSHSLILGWQDLKPEDDVTCSPGSTKCVKGVMPSQGHRTWW